MAVSKWERERLTWVQGLSDADLQRVLAEVNARSPLDENEGDRAERLEAVEWLLSRGERGDDWGIPGAVASDLGLWSGREGGH